jgi:hypothetical protein
MRMKTLETAVYQDQRRRWPQSGRHILAQHDDRSVVVYQAYRPSIADFAATYGRFGGEFSYSRMSWIKPNFLWMMYRCGWCSKEGQERVLAVHLSRRFFDWLLSQAVQSTYDPARFASREDWQSAVRKSCVRLQWDPDHNPTGGRLARKAIQLGLRGDALAHYGQEEPLEIEDITPFVLEQRTQNTTPGALLTPLESVYVPRDKTICSRIGLDAPTRTAVEGGGASTKGRPFHASETEHSAA